MGWPLQEPCQGMAPQSLYAVLRRAKAEAAESSGCSEPAGDDAQPSPTSACGSGRDLSPRLGGEELPLSSPPLEDLAALRRRLCPAAASSPSSCRSGGGEEAAALRAARASWSAWRSSGSSKAETSTAARSEDAASVGDSPGAADEGAAAADEAGGLSFVRPLSKEDLQRMREEMRRQCQRRQEDQVRRRHEAVADSPIFLSLRMRRILECALRLGPADVNAARAASSGFDPLLLEDHVAQAVAALVFHHGLTPTQVLASLRSWSEPLQLAQAPPAVGSELYCGLLDSLRSELHGEQIQGVDWALPMENRLPATIPVGVGPLGLRLMAGPSAASASASSSAQPAGPSRRLRSWFGPDEEAGPAEPYAVRRAIHMTDLPVYGKRALVTETVRANQVTLLQGETGSGKTTQVPAYVLEMALAAQSSQRAPVRIVVTQPRRIAAITVARRVAEELGEVVGEGVVGYKVRGVSACSPRCQILFCTTGVLLRRLAREGQKNMFSSKSVTHLLVDEVHERNCETDFMLTFLRQVLEERPQLRVVLMSATMDAECFLRFFALSPAAADARQRLPSLVQVEGRCYPTHEVFLDEINAKLGRDGAPKGMSPDELRRNPPRSLSESDGIDYELIVEILKAIDSSCDGAWQFVPDGVPADLGMQERKAGAVLVFLPGTGEISQLVANISEAGCPEHWWVIELHGALGTEEQQDAFRTTFPAGKSLKIIACTNVAETSVTVPDVTVVIDSCRERRTGVDKFSNTPQLKEQWCALDSLKQRRGRAGRVRPGVCLRLLSRSKAETLEGKTLPEMQRVPLENIYLQLCAIGIDDHLAFFRQTPDPPEECAVHLARAALRDLGALDDAATDGLTPLGRHLAALPCHPRLGKILVLGCLLSVPGPVLSICSAMSGRSPLMTTQDAQKRSAWQAERLRLQEDLGRKSDHCAWALLMQLWMSEGVVRRDLCKRFGLSYERMSAAWFERRHLGEALVQAGFLPASFLQEEREREQDPPPPDWTVVSAAVAGGLFPNIVQVEKSMPRTQGPQGNTPGDKNKWLRYSIMQRHLSGTSTASYGKSCNMHPNSLCFGQDRFHCPWLAFYTVQQTTKLYVYDATEVSPWALLLFGSQPEWNEPGQRLEVGGWTKFRCARGDLVLPLINAARSALQAALAKKSREPSYDAAVSPELTACVELLRTGGLGFEPAGLEPRWPLLDEFRAEGAEGAEGES